MHQDIAIAAGITSGVVGAVGIIPYIRDIFRRKTKPERTMWWIYTALFMLLFAAQLKADAKWLLIISGEYVLTSLIIAILSAVYTKGTAYL
jgi:hypothetical protein